MNSHNNFLLTSGYLESNLHEKGLTVEVPSNYNQIEVLIVTPATAIRRTFNLGQTKDRKFKDLRHTGIAETKENKAWTMSREVYSLKSG